jgi:hypothetical protein
MWGGERSCSRPRTPVGGRPLAALCWSKSKRLKVPRAKRHPGSSIPPYPSSRAARRTTLDRPTARSASCRPTGAGSVTGDAGSVTGDTTTTRSRHHILLVMAGIVPAISMRKSAALQAIEITGTRPVMTLRVRGPNETASGTRRWLSIGITGTDPRIKSGEVMTLGSARAERIHRSGLSDTAPILRSRCERDPEGDSRMDRKRPDLSGQSPSAASPSGESSLFWIGRIFDGQPDSPRLETILSNRRIARGEKPRPLFSTMR